MKNTPFTAKHIALGAKMAEFAGYNMPISYSGINDEHAAVRNNAGIFDVSHMGEFILKGEHALDLIQLITTNDAAKLEAGKAQYSCFPNDKGGIVDDLIVYCIEPHKVYMLVVNASNIEKDWNWITAHNTRKVEMHNISEKTCLLAIQGPNATRILQPLTDIDILNLKYYTFAKGRFAGVDNVLISATGYTGSGGIEIYFEDRDGAAGKIWDAIFELGGPQGLKPIGLGARDTLRLEMGYCLYGNDIDDSTSPLEGGLGWITKFSKDFIARGIIEKQKKMAYPGNWPVLSWWKRAYRVMTMKSRIFPEKPLAKLLPEPSHLPWARRLAWDTFSLNMQILIQKSILKSGINSLRPRS
jgi:aminomethyltransferase